MLLKKWEDLPPEMQNEMVRPYYESLQRKRLSLLCKLLFDKIASLWLLIVLSPLFLIFAILIKLDSEGEVFFRQVRVTRYGEKYYIYKFRTMVKNAEALGPQVTKDHDKRITKVGEKLRCCRLDELPQLINILKGEMSFVGTRPEVIRYFEKYTEEMMATLLLPAGVTSEACIKFKDEEKLLGDGPDADEKYINEVLPKKMKLNLQSLMNFCCLNDLLTMIRTILAVI
ncbi:MAG: sugar transferase [Negativicutes bacterium]|nr:sugar transferase [Negativicutes bacterium]